MRLAHIPLILLPLLTWAVQQSPPSPAETLDSAPPHSDSSPRAAIVALVEESDLSDLEVSVRQLEESFNAHYQYPWVFFSTEPLSEDFRQVVSTATTSVCFYETITPGNHTLNESHDLASPAHCHRCTSRHSLDSLAKQGRMRDYDWFLRVEPGALFTEHIEFDVFRFMQDREIGYGWLTGPRLYWIDDASSHLPKPNSSPAEMEIPPLDGAAGTCGLVACNMDGSHSDDFMVLRSGFGIPFLEGGGDLVNFDTDWKQTCAEGGQTKAVDCLGPRTELGSIAFFQSEGHEALIQHSLNNHCEVDPTDTPDDDPSEIFRVRKLRSIRVIPRYHLGVSRRVTGGIKPKFPGPTPAPVISILLYHVALSMEKHHSHWMWICEDMSRQAHVPGLKSGNTVIDERNFTPFYKF
ncbi:unnamed protein product [Clonostachys solani]|uniref:Uncharacterized protein n=1 Tax=Clonostachys solani TaxID=160281 RepID=A0A9N9Z861_9HYPO|nr:unnamed protein product [Clonostachys solani]